MPRPGEMPVGTGEKVDLGSALGRLARYAHRYAKVVLLAVVLAVAGAVLNLMGPGRLGQISDLITQGIGGTIDITTIGRMGAILAVIYLLGFAANYAQGRIMADVTQDLTRDMRRDMTAKIDRLPLRYLDSTPQGDTLSLMSNDVDSVG